MMGIGAGGLGKLAQAAGDGSPKTGGGAAEVQKARGRRGGVGAQADASLMFRAMAEAERKQVITSSPPSPVYADIITSHDDVITRATRVQVKAEVKGTVFGRLAAKGLGNLRGDATERRQARTSEGAVLPFCAAILCRCRDSRCKRERSEGG
jgi:hypothetical protein